MSKVRKATAPVGKVLGPAAKAPVRPSIDYRRMVNLPVVWGTGGLKRISREVTEVADEGESESQPVDRGRGGTPRTGRYRKRVRVLAE